MAGKPNRYRHSVQLSDAERNHQFKRYGRTDEDAYADRIRHSRFYCHNCKRSLPKSEWDLCQRCGRKASVDQMMNR